MRYAIIENNKVANIIEAEISYAKSIGAVAIGDIGVGIGDDYIDGKFKVKNAEDEIIQVAPFEIIEPIILSIEDRLNNIEIENKELKQQLEISQAVLDELLLGGTI